MAAQRNQWRQEGGETGTVRALDTKDGSERWSVSTGAGMSAGNRDNGPVAAHGFV